MADIKVSMDSKEGNEGEVDDLPAAQHPWADRPAVAQ